jgi:hypothetical protein
MTKGLCFCSSRLPCAVLNEEFTTTKKTLIYLTFSTSEFSLGSLRRLKVRDFDEFL